MWIGVGLIIVVFIAGLILVIRDKDVYAYAIGLPIIVIGMFLCNFVADEPSIDTIPYRLYVEGETIRFQDYGWDNNNLKIPTHYKIKWEWVNTYEYCAEPITIVIPEGQKVIINDLRPVAKPYIIGGCK